MSSAHDRCYCYGWEIFVVVVPHVTQGSIPVEFWRKLDTHDVYGVL